MARREFGAVTETRRRSTAERISIKKEKKGSGEARARRAMCESLSLSAKQLAGLGAFLASNGIAGCAIIDMPPKSPETPVLPETISKKKTERVADDLPITYEQMREELNQVFELSEAKVWPKTFEDWKKVDMWASVKQELSVHERRVATVKEGRQKERGAETFPVITGFERFGVSQEAVKNYLKTFPREWSDRANVQEISLDPHFIPIEYEGAIHGKAEFAHVTIHERTTQIVITSEEINQDEKKIITLYRAFESVLPHELAHTQSWRSSPELNQNQAMEFMYRTWKAATAEKRPKKGFFTYPEAIAEGKILDRMAEFYAVLMEEAMQFQDFNIDTWETWENGFAGRLEVESGADQEQAKWCARIVKRYFSLTEPDFKPWVAAKERDSAIYQIVKEINYSTALAELKDLHNDELHKVFELALKSSMDDGHSAKDTTVVDWDRLLKSMRPEGLQEEESRTVGLGKYWLNQALLLGLYYKERDRFFGADYQHGRFKILNDRLQALTPEIRAKAIKALVDYGKMVLTTPDIVASSSAE